MPIAEQLSAPERAEAQAPRPSSPVPRPRHCGIQSIRAADSSEAPAGLTKIGTRDVISARPVRIGSLSPCFAVWQILSETVPRPCVFSSNPIVVFPRTGRPLFAGRVRACGPVADSNSRGCCCRRVHGFRCWPRQLKTKVR